MYVFVYMCCMLYFACTYLYVCIVSYNLYVLSVLVCVCDLYVCLFSADLCVHLYVCGGGMICASTGVLAEPFFIFPKN